MLSTFATIVSLLNGLFNLVKGLFGIGDKPSDPTSNAVEVSNKVGHVSADVSRSTEAHLDEELNNAHSEFNAATDRVRDAGSVRDQQAAIDDAIARANAPAGPDH